MWNILRRPEYRSSDWRVLSEDTFQKLLHVERKRADRSQRRSVLMLLEHGGQEAVGYSALTKVLHALPNSIRETDVIGWYKNGWALGVIFTEVGAIDERTVRSVLSTKISQVLLSTLGTEQAANIRLLFEMMPETRDREVADDRQVVSRHGDTSEALQPKRVAARVMSASV